MAHLIFILNFISQWAPIYKIITLSTFNFRRDDHTLDFSHNYNIYNEA